MPEAIVIVGGGECGVRAALALRRRGWLGELTIVSEEQALPYERPPLSKAALISTTPPRPTTIVDEVQLASAAVRFISSTRVTQIDREGQFVMLHDGRSLAFDRLLLATGARARPLPLDTPPGVLTLRSLDDALELWHQLRRGTRVCVIGAGFIGLEVAAAATSRGCAVTVIEVAPVVLGRIVPAPTAGIVADRHAESGVDLRCNVSVKQIVRSGISWEVALDDKDVVDCDTVVAAIGAIPNTELAESAGLMIENGIRVDARLTTSDPRIFAAGDCCSFPHALFDDRRIRLEAWRNAQDHAEAVAVTMLGGVEPFCAVPWFWSDQYDLTLQIAGLPGEAASEVVRSRPDGVDVRFGLAIDGRLVSASAIGIGNSVARDIRLAERLIAARAHLPASALVDPACSLKSHLPVEERTG